MLVTLDARTGERGSYKSDVVTDFTFEFDVATPWLLLSEFLCSCGDPKTLGDVSVVFEIPTTFTSLKDAEGSGGTEKVFEDSSVGFRFAVTSKPLNGVTIFIVEGAFDESSLGIAAAAVTLALLNNAVFVSGVETFIDDCSVGCGFVVTLMLLSDGVTACRVVKALDNFCVLLEVAVTFALPVSEYDKPTLLFPSARSSCDLRIADSSSSVEAFTATVALS